MILDAKGRPWPEMTLLDIARSVDAPTEIMAKIIDKLVNPPIIMRGRPTGLLDKHGNPLYKEI